MELISLVLTFIINDIHGRLLDWTDVQLRSKSQNRVLDLTKAQNFVIMNTCAESLY